MLSSPSVSLNIYGSNKKNVSQSRQANSHLRNKVSHLKINFNAKYSQQSDAAPESHFEAVKIIVTCLVKKVKTKRGNK